MDSQEDQPMPARETINSDQSENGEQEESKEPKTRSEKIVAKLEELTGGDKEKAKKMFILFAGAGVLLPLALIISLIQRPSSTPRGTPTPTPTLIPAQVTPTPKPQVTKDDLDTLLEDINNFDTSQTDLIPPDLDLEIGL